MGVYRPRAPNPVVRAARSGKTAYGSRTRRMQDLAVGPTPENMMGYDMGAVTPVPGPSTTLRDPYYVGEEYWLWLNSTAGGVWDVDCGTVVGIVSFDTSPQYVLLKALTNAGVIEWALVSFADGVTFTGDGPGYGPGGIPVPP